MNSRLEPNMSREENVNQRAGWRRREWCAAIGIGRSTYYTLGPRAPRSVRVGGMRIILESPSDWLARVGRDVAS